MTRSLEKIRKYTRDHVNTVVIRARMVQNVTLKYSRHVSDTTKIRRVILAWTCDPRARVLDVHFTRWMRIVQKHSGHSRDRVLLVIYVRQIDVVRRVYVIRKSSVAHPRHAVGDCAHARACW